MNFVGSIKQRLRNTFLQVRESWHRPILNEMRRREIRIIGEQSGNPLLRTSTRLFSQNDEDGILIAVLDRIRSRSAAGVFLELGVGNGRENNTLILLSLGWSGAWLGGEELVADLQGSRLSYERLWITADNANVASRNALAKVGKTLDQVDVLSIDLDGNDFYIAANLLSSELRPAVIVVEYNGKFIPPAKFVQSYDEQHQWDGTDYYGSSLESWNDLFSGLRYQLVACSANGLNAFFVDTKYQNRFADIESSAAKLFMSPYYIVSPDITHPVSPRTLTAIAGVTGDRSAGR